MIFLRISAPFASFKHSFSREYAASFPVPSPATIYGCLLALVGEVDLEKHREVKLAIGLFSLPKVSRVLRKVRRWKDKDINAIENSRPDYQEVLCGLELVIGVDSQGDRANLADRIVEALNYPDNIDRFGGLSLGESRDLINDLQLLEKLPDQIMWLIPDRQGRLELPYRVDRQGSKETKFTKFNFTKFNFGYGDDIQTVFFPVS